MQQVEAIRPIGTLIQDRYVIEGLLGQGGFSAVYVVKSQDGQRFALKELRNQSKGEHARFLFECEVLSRLDHPALPMVSHVFEDGNNTYMLMEYIEGPNLEALRQRQPERRFTLSEVLTLLTPIVEAVAFLHAQAIPVLHRDIKPSNIIVPEGEGQAVLVDFGIAKEYYPDATTTAIRHCSPGYGAPEQYSGVGTDQRTDIYGLGATCYALLTGIVPVDALQRATMLAVKSIDPLLLANERVEAIPEAVAEVLQRAMAIGNEQRFASVEEFWQALRDASESKSSVSRTTSTDQLIVRQGISQRIFLLPQRRLFHVKGMRLLAVVFLLLLVLAGLASGVFIARPSIHTVSTRTIPVPARTDPTPTSVYPEVMQQYAGTITDLLTHKTTTMTLLHVQQNNAVISGNFEGLKRSDAFTGVLDTSKHLLFTVAGHGEQAQLFFEGFLRSDGNLVGNYCRQDSSGQCLGDYGIWSVAPQVR